MIYNNYLLSVTVQNLGRTETKNESREEAENTKGDFQNRTSSHERARVNDQSANTILLLVLTLLS